ncbi:pyrroline-5-carboxylate reductase [Pseudohaliea rubra]|uniref:Pyrroline-5-carboxylate reductase n=1 Tax=Pseudohaliea rubra DSM 19751 TaxID=1265313 RepID=A0A095VRX2_9GAMM|nr:pyrroline-5-carboxylate reductase [Pseudohaliea rubra]KGE04202.1 Pyrroline-5-carboxylate reductase [Pseudohaliea rubra DSM 19751]
MAEIRIAFIGAGNMAASIIGGLVAEGHPASTISASDPSPESLARLREVAPVATGSDNREAVTGADVVILAVKPQVMARVCIDIAPALAGGGAVALSIAAGIPVASLERWLGPGVPVIRCMPNTPALLGAGASGLYATAAVSAAQRAHAGTILSAVGLVRWVDSEDDLHAVTAVSGSGPAYFFLFMEAMAAEGQRLGLDAETATALTAQTCLGAARMAAESGIGLAELRRRVCSPGGTTERAIASFQSDELEATVARAMTACLARSKEMADELG